MSRVHVTTQIDAPLREVWDTVMDPQRFGEWVTIHRAVHKVSDRPLCEGATMEQTLRMHGVSFRVKWSLVRITAPCEAEWEGRGPAGSRAHIGYRLSGGDSGPTKFEYSNEFTTPGGRLGNAASRALVGGASEREAENSLSRLKALLEKR